MESGGLQKVIYMGGAVLVAAAVLLLAIKILSENLSTGREYRERAQTAEVALEEIQHRR
jgi:hypothetical protein